MRPVPPLDVRVRRVYDEPSAADGTRVLVDRIWPRGLRKDAIRLDDWAKDAAPSTELRTWYGHDPAKFEEFRQRYLGELAGSTQRAALGRLRALAVAGRPLGPRPRLPPGRDTMILCRKVPFPELLYPRSWKAGAG